MDSLQRPLVVDLDRALLACDLAAEGRARRWVGAPLAALGLGEAVAEEGEPDPANLPWNAPVLDWLRAQHAAGRRLVLASHARDSFVQRVARHLALFDAVLHLPAGDADARSAALVARYGAGGYDFLGHGGCDLPALNSAAGAVLVGPGAGQLQTAPLATLAAPRAGWRVWLRALRVHQWVKNLLVFLPLLAAHSADPRLWGQALLASLAFGLCASAVYLLNDLLDVEHDRHHPRKRQRPFAAGLLRADQGLRVAALLVGAAAVVASLLPWRFGLVLALYGLMTSLYSLGLKRIAILDVLWLAALYTLRVLAGAAACAILPSVWLLCFSMFAFLSLACLKRYTELIDLQQREGAEARGRGYQTDDLSLVAVQGNAAGYLAVLVLILYINSRDVGPLYPSPYWLWGVALVLMYWFNRSWWLAHRGRLHDDPIVYAVRDRASRWLGLTALACLLLASWPA
ncbi:UbiA family prenyltransferase [Massilia sp. TS11]|uniref:UbiA family prenyltransferase n=1 Tax=Massilia sp. TS11 TaxID=2908003 RepID=UPI001EDAEB43|nr:UbiA family prenyltransferase [Massilia sp. TS11]MCG2585926.1 UbiA family prenyltransferase [Massilia sp. TS11]